MDVPPSSILSDTSGLFRLQYASINSLLGPLIMTMDGAPMRLYTHGARYHSAEVVLRTVSLLGDDGGRFAGLPVLSMPTNVGWDFPFYIQFNMGRGIRYVSYTLFGILDICGAK